MQYSSIPSFSDSQWAVMSRATNATLVLALFLLPLCLLWRLAHDRGHARRVLFSPPKFLAFYQAAGLLLLLVVYRPLLEVLDWLVARMMQAWGTSAPLPSRPYSLWEGISAPLASIASFFNRFYASQVLTATKSYLHYLRGCLLLVSTAVGPLAIAVSSAPGYLSRALPKWLGLHLSFLCGGITMVALDGLLEKAGVMRLGEVLVIDFIRDRLGDEALTALYLLAVPLVSLVLGHLLCIGVIVAARRAFPRRRAHALHNFLVRLRRSISSRLDKKTRL